MFVLNRTIFAVVFGSVVGSLAASPAALGKDTLMNTGDYGSFINPAPDGFSDQVWATNTNGFKNTVSIQYMESDAINFQDTAGQVVSVLIGNSGSGYGRNCTQVPIGATFNASNFIGPDHHHQVHNHQVTVTETNSLPRSTSRQDSLVLILGFGL